MCSHCLSLTPSLNILIIMVTWRLLSYAERERRRNFPLTHEEQPISQQSQNNTCQCLFTSPTTSSSFFLLLLKAKSTCCTANHAEQKVFHFWLLTGHKNRRVRCGRFWQNSFTMEHLAVLRVYQSHSNPCSNVIIIHLSLM